MSLANKLTTWQKDLIDMSKRNPLLYYKSEGRGAGIQFLPDSPSQLFSRLIDRPGSITLEKTPSAIEPEDLERRLLRLKARVREDERDRGIKTLYMVFGMLQWYEAAFSQDVICSPLIFVPASLTHKKATDSFILKPLDGSEWEVNPTLREKLKHDHGITLPTYSDMTSGDRATLSTSPIFDDLLHGIQVSLPQGDRWKILQEVHLGRFAFQKLVMYQDLQRHSADVLAHPLLRVLGGETPRTALPSSLPSMSEFDDRVPPQDMFEILDADSSQQEAILLAKADISFVLKGPPGTGKSQTIANIIAETLGQGKHVLFVSEKMAALDVVRKRLDGAGLGDFCLDLHNPQTNTAQKLRFLRALKTSLDEATRSPEVTSETDWERQSSELQRCRTELNTYERELHQKRQPLEKSAFNAFGELAKLTDTSDLDFSIPHIDTVTANQFDAMVRTIDQLGACHGVLDAYDSHTWRETQAKSYSLELESTVRARYTRFSASLRTLHASLATMLDLLGEHAIANFSWMQYAMERTQAVLASPQPPRSWLHREALVRLRPVVADMMACSEIYAQQRRQFDSIYSRALLREDLAVLRLALTENSAWAMSCLRDQRGYPQDSALDNRAELRARLTTASHALAAIPAAATTLADMCGAEQPETLGETGALIALARHMLQPPAALPSAWLDASACAVVRATAAEAQERYVQCAQMRKTLEDVYQPSFFMLDLPGLLERFHTEYRSFFRLLKVAFHRDITLVRSQLLPGQTRSVAQIEADVTMAVKALETESLLAEKRIEYAKTLDRYFDGAQTDWKRLHDALRWLAQLHEHLAGALIPAPMAALIAGPAKALRPVNVALDQLAGLFATWEEAETFCINHLQIAPLLQGVGSFADVAPTQAHAAIDKVLHALRAFWQAVDTVLSHRHLAPAAGQPARWATLCADVERAHQISDFEMRLAAQANDYTRDFGHFYQSTATNWQTIAKAITWTEGFLKLYPDRAIPEETAVLVAYPSDTTRRDALQSALTHIQQTRPVTNEELAYSDKVLARTALTQPDKTFETSALTAIADRIDFLREQLPALEQWLTCQQRLEICRQAGLESFIENLLNQRPIPQNLSAIFQRRFYLLWLDIMRRQSPILAKFPGTVHSSAVQAFCSLDNGHKALARKRLCAKLAQRRQQIFSDSGGNPRLEFSQAAVAIRKAAEAKKGHRSAIRVTVNKTALALLELKPCWMMSPLSVSQFLESGKQIFDLVIFDEASQVCPEDSISSILRGKQLIVVGDEKQLPPTHFFSKSLADENDDNEEEDEEEERTQSILNECLGAAFRRHSLQWHYRSADESLIAFSNQHFYGNQLVTFPSPFIGDRGIRFEYVANGVYGFGGNRKNRLEAERVADIVFGYLHQHEDRSLGIVALSAAQQEAISDALFNRLKREPHLQHYYDDLFNNDLDGIFIKNLESVQGDERDTIILSIGYGRDASGRMHYNFGPINKTGGERRLNVAVTRARKQMIVVSSIKASHLPLSMISQGARILRYYLEYAEKYAEQGAQVLAEQTDTGGVGHGADAPETRFESPFEEAVYNALTARGLTLDTQVGCSRYRIDLAVRDPDHPGDYLLGIECDGATYHSSKTARDRDRLRQWQLEKMGWKLHRIWSTDWFTHSKVETQRVLDAVEQALKARKRASTAQPPHDDPDSAEDMSKAVAHRLPLRLERTTQEGG